MGYFLLHVGNPGLRRASSLRSAISYTPAIPINPEDQMLEKRKARNRRMQKRRRQRRSIGPMIIAAAAIVIIIIIAVLLLNGSSGSHNYKNKSEYYGIEEESQVPLIVDDQIQESYGKLIDGKVYVDYMTAWDCFNAAFYWSEEEQQLLQTMPAETLRWAVDDSTGQVITGDDGTIYLSADLIQENSDIDFEVYTDPDRIVARTNWTDLTTAQVTEDMPVREKAGSRSDILTDLTSGDTVVCLDTSEDWYQVSTADGYIGYLPAESCQIQETSSLTHTTDSAYEFSHVYAEGKTTLAWHYVDNTESNAILSDLLTNVQGLNVISPTWFSLADTAGNLTSFADKAYVDSAHSAGLKVWALLGSVTGAEVDASGVLKSSEARSTIISQLMASADATGFDGINVDFETISYEDMPAFLQFLKELCTAAHEKGLVVSSDNYVPTYTKYYHRAEQARTVDYIIIMGYDEHNTDSEEAGSVASLPFVEEGITDTLKEVPAAQVINAVPFYTRSWTQPFGSDMLYSEALSMEAGRQFADEKGMELAWDASVGQYTGSVEDDEARYSIWLEDAESISAKLELSTTYGLAGTAAWRLGLETADVWPLFAAYLGNG